MRSRSVRAGRGSRARGSARGDGQLWLVDLELPQEPEAQHLLARAFRVDARRRVRRTFIRIASSKRTHRSKA